MYVDIKVPKEELSMTIHHKPRRTTVSDVKKKERIKAIIDENPAILASVQDLVNHDSAGRIEAKRNRAIFAVYIKNAVFGVAVDRALDS